MKRLSKEQRRERDRLIGELEAVQAKLEQAAAEYTAKLGEAQDFCRRVVEEMEAYEGDRSEKWADSEAGQRYVQWREDWENVEFSEYVDLEYQAAEVLGSLDEECPS